MSGLGKKLMRNLSPSSQRSRTTVSSGLSTSSDSPPSSPHSTLDRLSLSSPSQLAAARKSPPSDLEKPTRRSSAGLFRSPSRRSKRLEDPNGPPPDDSPALELSLRPKKQPKKQPRDSSAPRFVSLQQMLGRYLVLLADPSSPSHFLAERECWALFFMLPVFAAPSAALEALEAEVRRGAAPQSLHQLLVLWLRDHASRDFSEGSASRQELERWLDTLSSRFPQINAPAISALLNSSSSTSSSTSGFSKKSASPSFSSRFSSSPLNNSDNTISSTSDTFHFRHPDLADLSTDAHSYSTDSHSTSASRTSPRSSSGSYSHRSLSSTSASSCSLPSLQPHLDDFPATHLSPVQAAELESLSRTPAVRRAIEFVASRVRTVAARSLTSLSGDDSGHLAHDLVAAELQELAFRGGAEGFNEQESVLRMLRFVSTSGASGFLDDDLDEDRNNVEVTRQLVGSSGAVGFLCLPAELPPVEEIDMELLDSLVADKLDQMLNAAASSSSRESKSSTPGIANAPGLTSPSNSHSLTSSNTPTNDSGMTEDERIVAELLGLISNTSAIGFISSFTPVGPSSSRTSSFMEPSAPIIDPDTIAAESAHGGGGLDDELSISSIASKSGAVGFMDSDAVGFKSNQQKGAAGDPTESRSFGHKIAPEAFSVEATASQMGLALTQRTKELFEAVDLREFLDYGFGAKLSSRETTSRSIEWFNLVSNWVATRIMSAKGLQLRIVVVKRFIALAIILQRLCNFHLLCAVSAGIKSSAVSRLKKTWAGVPQSLQRKLTEIDEFMSPFKNYSKYRDCIVNMIALGQPCLPYLGIYLRDLTFIHEANATFESTLINQSKFLQVLQVLEDFNHFRDHPIAPDLRQCSAVQLQYVTELSGTCSDPQKLYQISLDLEPRESSLSNSDGASSKQVDDEFSLNRLTILDPALLPRYQLEKAFIALQKHCVELLLQADLPHKL